MKKLLPLLALLFTALTVFGYIPRNLDNAPIGLGVLTKVSEPQSGGAVWSASLDGFDRIEKETNNVIRRLATGRVNATEQYASISVTLDGRTLPYYLITATNPPWKRQWQAMMELRPGPHTLTAVAKHSSGLFETNKTAVFTNNAVDQTTIGRFAEGQLNQRIWKNAAGQTNRVEELKWDGRGRLWFRSELDSNNNGYRWSAVYDGLGRRVQTTTIIVTNGVALTDQPQIISQIYDPGTEGLELAVQVEGRTIWKVYGPDLNGVYAGLNGKGGFEGIVDDLGLFHAAISDARGNLLAERNPTTGAVTWTAARPTAYGAVPEYRPVPLVRSGNFIASSAWGGRWPDISGDYCSKYRYYYPVGGYFLSFDPADDPANLNGYTYCGGDPVNFDDPDGRFGKKALNSATGIDLDSNVPLGVQLQAYREGGEEWIRPKVVEPVAKTVDFGVNLAIAAFGPSPGSYTPQQRTMLTQIAIEEVGSPMQSLYGGDGSTWAQELPAQFGPTIQDVILAYGSRPGFNQGSGSNVQARRPKPSNPNTVQTALPELHISAGKYPELAENILHAQKAGHPSVLTHGGNRAANRTAALEGVPNIQPFSRDEYPFASSMQGGSGSWVGHVPVSQQNAQGALLKNFFKQNNIKTEDQYRVIIDP